jgi:hypothetical protein
MAAYFKAMKEVLTSLHPSETGRSKGEQLARQVIDFETRLSSVLPEIDDLYDVNVRIPDLRLFSFFLSSFLLVHS